MADQLLVGGDRALDPRLVALVGRLLILLLVVAAVTAVGSAGRGELLAGDVASIGPTLVLPVLLAVLLVSFHRRVGGLLPMPWSLSVLSGRGAPRVKVPKPTHPQLKSQVEKGR